MGKNILVPTDFSMNSWNALQYTIKLYEEQECDFYILNVFSTEAYGLDGLTTMDPDHAFNKISEKNSIQGLGDIMVRLTFENDNPNHRYNVISRSMPFLEAIKSVVGSQEIDLIVLGAKGMANEGRCKYGKHTLQVIDGIRKCPVLVIPMDVSFTHPEEIVLATDFNSDFRKSEIKHLSELARITNARIKVISQTGSTMLSPLQKKNKMWLRNYFREVEHSFNDRHYENVADVLKSLVKGGYSDMISYIDKKPSFWEQLGFGKPTLGKLGNFKDKPVLVLNERA